MIIFSFQGNVILENPLHIALIAVPLILQTVLIFFIAYLAARAIKLPHNVAGGAGHNRRCTFMLMLVGFANRTTGWFKE